MDETLLSHVCAFCQAKSSYVCPRCGINYCSLTCYRNPKHQECSEAFYRDCCLESMRNSFVDPESKTKMLDILRREASAQYEVNPDQSSENADLPMEKEQRDDDPLEDSDDFEARFSNLNLESEEVDGDIIWTRLTLKERREFCRLVASGGLSNYIPKWDPWWSVTSKPCIEEVTKGDAQDECTKKISLRTAPIPLKNIFPSGKTPHHSMIFVLAEVVLGYAFLCRLYNGDYRDLAHEYLMRLCQISPSVCHSSRSMITSKRDSGVNASRSNRTVILTPVPTRSPLEYTTFTQVVAAVQLRLSDLHLSCSPPMIILLLEDLNALFSKESYLLRVFSELLDLVRWVREHSEFEDDVEAQDSRKQLQIAYQKLRFLQACINPSDEDAQRWQSSHLNSLRSQIQSELCRHVSNFDPRTSTSGVTRGPAAGPNWREMVRTIPHTQNEPSIIVLNSDPPMTKCT